MEYQRAKFIDLVLMDEPSDEVEEVYVSAAADTLKNYAALFRELDRNVAMGGDSVQVRRGNLRRIMDILFEDGVYNWGRVIVAIIWARKIGKGDPEIGNILADKLGWWVYTNGGFEEGFVGFFSKSWFRRVLNAVSNSVFGNFE